MKERGDLREGAGGLRQDWCRRVVEGGHRPENWMAKPCLLVKKSVLNWRTTELKVLWRSLGRAGPLSSFSRTPLSTGPSQMRRTSWTSSVSNTRKWSLSGEKRQVVTQGSAPSFQWFPVTASHTPKNDLQEGIGSDVWQLCSQLPSWLLCPLGSLEMGTRVRKARFCASCLLLWNLLLPPPQLYTAVPRPHFWV